MPDEDLRRFWFVFDECDRHGCKLPYRCGVTAWNETDALRLVAETYCERSEPPTPQTTIPDFDVSELDEDQCVRPHMGVTVWRGIWFPFITRT
jgi:hypothetical protein